jgi:hypothetical protein
MRGAAAIVVALSAASASAQTSAGAGVTYAYTQFDADKTCKHRKGREVEDYGTWTCPGYAGIPVVLSAGDQRMQVSFGPRASREVAAGETFPAFNDVYTGTIEWRLAPGRNGKPAPYATILRWNYMTSPDDRKASGRALVVTRLNPGGVCHVGYVDARANPDANDIARKLADEKARGFVCGKDKPVWHGKRS